MFIGSTDTKGEAPIVWPPGAKNQLIGKELDSRKEWGQEEKRVTENEMVGWHHGFNEYEFDQTLGDSKGHESLAYCILWSHKELDKTY